MEKLVKSQSPQSKGGQVMAEKQRRLALDRYYKNPNYCLQCKTLIKVPESKKVPAVRKQKFCGRSCSTIFNNLKGSTGGKKKKICRRFCLDCKSEVTYTDQWRNKFCLDCSNLRASKIANSTKIEVDRRVIYHHSQNVMKKIPRVCNICGYEKHAEICHIKAISLFHPTATLKEMNAPNNLIMLCPNHHWELDHNLLSLPLTHTEHL